MKLIGETNIDFLKMRLYAAIGSLITIVIGLFSVLVHNGLNYGIDFRGGTNVQIQFNKNIAFDDIRSAFDTHDMQNVVIQRFGEEEDNEILAAFPSSEEIKKGDQLTETIRTILMPLDENMEVRRVETVGPTVGEELKSKAIYAVGLALGLILIYITFRFKWTFGVSAIITLVHDVTVVIGFFSLFDKEFSLPVVAALLTVVGYSLNDTIVVFDRIRENTGRFRRKSLYEMINQSINETLSRTLLTSATTLFVVCALFVFGGEIIHDFSFALLVGIVVGTYSSIFVASPILHWLQVKVLDAAQGDQATKTAST